MYEKLLNLQSSEGFWKENNEAYIFSLIPESKQKDHLLNLVSKINNLKELNNIQTEYVQVILTLLAMEILN